MSSNALRKAVIRERAAARLAAALAWSVCASAFALVRPAHAEETPVVAPAAPDAAPSDEAPAEDGTVGSTSPDTSARTAPPAPATPPSHSAHPAPPTSPPVRPAPNVPSASTASPEPTWRDDGSWGWFIVASSILAGGVVTTAGLAQTCESGVNACSRGASVAIWGGVGLATVGSIVGLAIAHRGRARVRAASPPSAHPVSPGPRLAPASSDFMFRPRVASLCPRPQDHPSPHPRTLAE
jgi:hypothetical protein